MRYDVPNVMETFHLYFLCASGLIATSIGSPIAGPYLINSEFVKTCEGRETTSYWQSRVKLSKFNAKEPVVFQTLSGNTTITHDVDDTFWFRLRFDSRSSNQQRWVRNALIFNFPVNGCSVIRKQAPGIAQAVFGKEFLNSNPCLLKQGLYIHDNAPLNMSFPNFPILPYGYYRIEMNMGLDADQKRDLACVQNVAHVIPQPKRLQNG